MSLKTFFKIGDANAEITRLTTELAAAIAAQQTAEQARAAAVAEVTPLKAQITTLEGQVATLTTERDTARTELATANESIKAKDGEIASLKGEKTTVEQRAAEIAAGVGSQAALNADPGAEASKTREQLWTEYNSLPVADRNAFYRKHRAKLKE